MRIRYVSDCIVGLYYNVRLDSTLGYLPPNVYEIKSATIEHIVVSEIT
jgi:hypothetical protein